MSVKQSYIDRINDNIAKINALNSDEFVEEAKKKNASKKQADIDVINAGYDTQIKNTQDAYDQQIDDTNIAYANEYERNAVQKLINEKQIAERNANLGITDSGVNRTQQSAIQLSYANQKGAIDLARQKTLDSLGLSLTNAITTLQNEKDGNIRNLENEWDNLSYEQGINAYNDAVGYYNDQIATDSDVLASIYQSEDDTTTRSGGVQTDNYILKTSGGLLSRDFSGSFADNNIDVIYNNNGTTTYVDNNSGKKTTLDSTINPFTGTVNKDVKNGTFKNGYQPNNINGVRLKTYEEDAIIVNNQLQKVFVCNGTYYAWDGRHNEYFEVVRVEKNNGEHSWKEKI